jgi:hypothetical protein
MKYNALIVVLVALIMSGCGRQPPEQQQTGATEVRPATYKAPDESAALAAIAAVNDAQKNYMHRNRRYALTYDELVEAHFLKEEPTVQQTGYEIKLRPAADAGSYTVVAIPSAATVTSRHFFSDQTGVIRAEQSKDANAQSPAVTQ